MQNEMLTIQELDVAFEDFKLQNINLSVKKGEYFVLLGESGAGKSLILEAIAGIVKPDRGEIVLNGENISNQKINKRKVGIVFQDYAVFPHMSVKRNIEYSIKKAAISKQEKKERIMACTGLMNISGLLHRMPSTLSGGELQRVAFARTLVSNPECLLLDEPLSAVDIHLKDELRMLLRTINRKGQTIVHVTHSYNEAVSLAQRIGIIENGKILQVGTPVEVFSNPQSKFTAKLSGTQNFFKAVITEPGSALCENKIKIRLTGGEIGSEGFASFRAEDVVVSEHALDSSLTNRFEAVIVDIIPGIEGIELVADTGIKIHARISFKSFDKMKLQTGNTVIFSFKATAVKFIPLV